MAVAWSRERHSARKLAFSGTPFRTMPPEMTPTLAVVWWSSRPSSSAAMARAAARMAEMPRSGSMPAWAARPVTSTSMAT